MADELLDEYEQSERVKAWLKENALSLVLGIAIGLAGLVGWGQWQVYQVNHKSEAAAAYNALTTEVDMAAPEALAERAGTLESDYSDTAYAGLALMQLGAQELERGDAAAALAAYRRAASLAKPNPMRNIAQLRIARLLIENGEPQQALDEVKALTGTSFEGAAQEVRGDALVALGQPAEARAAYQKALDDLQSDFGLRQLIEMKMQALGEA